MVLFLDKKEQVIEFELTNHGKHLFSVGKLDPKFYSFYDDDILYDSITKQVQLVEQLHLLFLASHKMR